MENVQTSTQQFSSLPSSDEMNPEVGKTLHTTLFSDPKSISCKKCSRRDHELKDCPDFVSLTPAKRCDEVKLLKVCMKCLASDHSFRNCKVRCAKCKKGHNFLLHYDISQPPSQSPTHSMQPSTSAQSATQFRTPPVAHGQPQASSTPTSNRTLLAVQSHRDTFIGSAIVDILDDFGNRFPVHALLDSGSTAHIVSEAVAQRVSARTTNDVSLIGGVGASCTTVTGSCRLKLCSRVSGKVYDICASTVSKVSDPHPSKPIDISIWNIPSHAQLANPTFNIPQEVDLLIGAGLFWTLLRPGRLLLGPDLPHLEETELGWIVVGPMASTSAAHTTLMAVQHNNGNSNGPSFRDSSHDDVTISVDVCDATNSNAHQERRKVDQSWLVNDLDCIRTVMDITGVAISLHGGEDV